MKCSTPYGIRGLARIVPRFTVDCACGVLNALRHQRFGTDLAWYAPYGELRVLNALRHQRFGT